MAAEALGKVQTEFLDGLTQEITENYENDDGWRLHAE